MGNYFIDGLTLAVIFLAYIETSIAITFFITSLTFAIMSIYGYFTDSDLSSWDKIVFVDLTAYDTQKIKQMG